MIKKKKTKIQIFQNFQMNFRVLIKLKIKIRKYRMIKRKKLRQINNNNSKNMKKKKSMIYLKLE